MSSAFVLDEFNVYFSPSALFSDSDPSFFLKSLDDSSSVTWSSFSSLDSSFVSESFSMLFWFNSKWVAEEWVGLESDIC